MSSNFGFFSIIRFVPNLLRSEFVNVGIVAVFPDKKIIFVKLTENDDYVAKRFPDQEINFYMLKLAKESLKNRVEFEAVNWTKIEDLSNFSSKEGNHIRLSKPSLILIIEDTNVELEILYKKMVH